MKFTKFFLLALLTSLTLMACQNDKTPNKKQTISDIKARPNQDVLNIVQPDQSVASANFEVNEYFETFIEKNKSNTDIVNIDKPKMGGELLRKAEKVKLEISGYWANPKTKNINTLTLEVYPNAFKSGTDNRAIVEQKLKLSKEKRYFIFAYLNYLNLNEGLYYYFLKNENTIIYTGKFMVK